MEALACSCRGVAWCLYIFPYMPGHCPHLREGGWHGARQGRRPAAAFQRPDALLQALVNLLQLLHALLLKPGCHAALGALHSVLSSAALQSAKLLALLARAPAKHPGQEMQATGQPWRGLSLFRRKATAHHKAEHWRLGI